MYLLTEVYLGPPLPQINSRSGFVVIGGYAPRGENFELPDMHALS